MLIISIITAMAGLISVSLDLAKAIKQYRKVLATEKQWQKDRAEALAFRAIMEARG